MHVFIDLLAHEASRELKWQLVDAQIGIVVESYEINEFNDKFDRVKSFNFIPVVLSSFQKLFVSLFD